MTSIKTAVLHVAQERDRHDYRYYSTEYILVSFSTLTIASGHGMSKLSLDRFKKNNRILHIRASHNQSHLPFKAT